MTRSTNPPTMFIALSLILLLEASHIVKCELFYQEVNDIMSISLQDERTSVHNTITNCFRPADICDLGSKDCCSGSACRCNLWGYNCRCQFNDYMLMPAENEKEPIGNPSPKHPLTINVERRSCIRRGGACDHRPNDCCFSSSCRCNLWGSNCRCQRVGLFQKWG